MSSNHRLCVPGGQRGAPGTACNDALLGGPRLIAGGVEAGLGYPITAGGAARGRAARAYLLETHGVAGSRRQPVLHRRRLGRVLGHTGRVLRQPLRVDHAVKLAAGEDGDDDIVAVTLYPDVCDRTSRRQ